MADRFHPVQNGFLLTVGVGFALLGYYVLTSVADWWAGSSQQRRRSRRDPLVRWLESKGNARSPGGKRRHHRSLALVVTAFILLAVPRMVSRPAAGGARARVRGQLRALGPLPRPERAVRRRGLRCRRCRWPAGAPGLGRELPRQYQVRGERGRGGAQRHHGADRHGPHAVLPLIRGPRSRRGATIWRPPASAPGSPTSGTGWSTAWATT
ncbi:hypothetical protein QJS66_00340 [Kocuria rhizophila]|nr:hypothetical protein QJS66_00340 [Kocuria rhizophila]